MLLAGFVLAVRQELIDIPPRWNPRRRWIFASRRTC